MGDQILDGTGSNQTLRAPSVSLTRAPSWRHAWLALELPTWPRRPDYRRHGNVTERVETQQTDETHTGESGDVGYHDFEHHNIRKISDLVGRKLSLS